MQTFMLAGVVQRTMFSLRASVEAKIHRLPLSYIDRHSRGDLLSRVTNDIDNISQSLQQSLSQLITSLLTIVGVLLIMIWISPLLALVAVITVPISIGTMKQIAGRSKQKFIAQWAHTGAMKWSCRGNIHRSCNREVLLDDKRKSSSVSLKLMKSCTRLVLVPNSSLVPFSQS